MKIAIATDSWVPQVNGVVRALVATVEELDLRGHDVELITPARCLTTQVPDHPSIDDAAVPRFVTRRLLRAFVPDVVHIATHGPIGWSARVWCLANGVPFTTAFHTRFPEWDPVHAGLAADRIWSVLSHFHRHSRAVLVPTPSLERELAGRGIGRTRLWTRGIDHWLFRAAGDLHPAMTDLPRPILLSVGQVTAAKNLEAFLALDVAGSKVVVGEGPALAELKARYPHVRFLGALAGKLLAAAYRSADALVFPSRTDTFGLPMIEALACGLPVAAFPVAGPLDVLGRAGRGPEGDLPGRVGCLDPDLATAVAGALGADRKWAAAYARRFTWEAAADQFLTALESAVSPRLKVA